MSFKYDIPVLCQMMEVRPCLWDKKDFNHKNKVMRENAWEEIFETLVEGYAYMSAEDKRDAGDKIMCKWTNTRDAFFRSLKTKRGSEPKKNYLYYEHLLFLLPGYVPRKTGPLGTMDSSYQMLDAVDCTYNTTNHDYSHEEILPTLAEKSSKKRKTEEIHREIKRKPEEEIPNKIDSSQIEEGKCSFFTSFECYLSDMTENEKLQLHASILKAITDIKTRRIPITYKTINSH